MTKKSRRQTAEGRREEFVPICLSAFWLPKGGKGQKRPLNNVSVALVPWGKLAQQEGFEFPSERNIEHATFCPLPLLQPIDWQVGIWDREVVIT